MKYLTVEDPNDFYYFDIETNGLTPDTVWCAVFKNKGTRQVWTFKNDGSSSIYHDIRKFVLDRPTACFCAHNGTSFDAVVLSYLCGLDFPLDRLVDTLVLSYLYNPALDGGHSLASYGVRLRFPKGDYSDWSKLTPEMVEYCQRDVDLLELVHDALLRKMNGIGFSELSCSIEHNIRHIIDQQESNGFYFNSTRATDLLERLRSRRSDLSDSVHRLFPPELTKLGEHPKRRRKDGSDSLQYQKDLSRYIIRDIDGEAYETWYYKEFNIGSPQQRLERLLQLGYVPTAKTKKGNPRIDEDSLLAYAKEKDQPELLAMAEWLVTTGRIQMIAGNDKTRSPGWLGFLNSETSRIHGKVMTCGATSRRMTHNSPNMANIPSAANGAMYGEECRSCWTVTPGLGRKLVGYDAKGLETGVMCHFLDNPEANKLLLEGDVHTANQKALQRALDALLGLGWGEVVRGGGGAKTAFYAALFGAYPPKLGSIFKLNSKAGEVIQKVLYDTVPGLGKAFKDAQAEYNRTSEGFMRCLDGGYVRCPSEGSAFNYRIQPNGGILMKLTTIFLTNRARQKGIWNLRVVDCHDEGQHEVLEKDADEFGRLAIQCIADAAEELGFRVKMTGTYHVGDTWAQTH